MAKTHDDHNLQSFTSISNTKSVRDVAITDPTTGVQATICPQHGLNVCPSSDFFFEVAKGDIPGHTGVAFQGYNDEVTAITDPEDLITQGGLVVMSSTADIGSVTSSNAADTTTQVLITGLDANLAQVSQVVTLNGRTPVLLTTPLLRVYTMTTIVNEPLGNVYLYVTGSAITNGVPNSVANIRLQMDIGTNIGLSGVYTVPAGYTGYVFELYVALSGTTRAECDVHAILYRNGIRYVIGRGAISASGSSIWYFDPPFPLVLQEGDSAWVQLNQTSAACGMVHAARIILVEN